MRIFLAISPFGTGWVKNNQTWLRNLYEPLVDLGHEVYLFHNDLIANNIKAEPGQDKFKEEFTQKLLDAFRRENEKPFDVFLSYFIDDYVDAGAIDEIKKTGVATCNFSCNNTHQFYLTKKIAPHFDYNLHSEKDAREKFKSIGSNPVWFPMAANPKYYHPYDLKKEYDVTFVGQNYARRPYYIWHLLENGIDVRVWGPGWRRKEKLPFLRIRKAVRLARKLRDLTRLASTRSLQKRYHMSSHMASKDFRDYVSEKYKEKFGLPLSDEEMIKMYSRSKVSLGFLEVYDAHDPSAIVKQHLHLREFEAPMSGALYFTNYCEELAEFYQPDKEVIVYRNEHELLDKVKYYLARPDEAEKIRKAGHRRALSCHTYQKRLEVLFKAIGI